MGHFFSKLFRRSGNTSSDDTQKASSSGGGGSSTKRQLQHSTEPTLVVSDSPRGISGQDRSAKSTNQQATTISANINQPVPLATKQQLKQQTQQEQLSQRYPVNESNETSPTNRPHIVYRSAPLQPNQPTPSPVSGNQEVEDAVIKIQALVRGHLTRKALKDGASSMNPAHTLGERQFDERSLYNPPSAVFLPSSPFNITSTQLQNRNHRATQHHCQTTQDNSQSLDNRNNIDRNIDQYRPGGEQPTDNYTNDASYDANNNKTAENNSSGIISTNNDNNLGDAVGHGDDRPARTSTDHQLISPTLSCDSNTASTELDISTIALYPEHQQRQQSIPDTSQTGSASIVINDYLTPGNSNKRFASVPIAAVLHPPQLIASPASTVETPTILESSHEDGQFGGQSRENTENGRNLANRLNVITNDDDNENLTNNQRQSRQSSRHLEEINSNNNVGGLDSTTTPVELEGAVIKIQSAFRGYRTRKNSPYRSSSARRSPATPSEDSERKSIPNGYHLQTLEGLSQLPAATSPLNDEQQNANNVDDAGFTRGDAGITNICRPQVSNLAQRRLAKQCPTENDPSEGSAEDQHQPSVSPSLQQSISVDDENTCTPETVIEGKARNTLDNRESDSIEKELKNDDDNCKSSTEQQNEEIKSTSFVDESEKSIEKSMEHNQQWPSQEQDTDSSALGAALSFNDETEDEAQIITTPTLCTDHDNQQLSSALEVGIDNTNDGDFETDINSRNDDSHLNAPTDELNSVDISQGNLLPRASINSTTADISFVNEDDESMMRQVQKIIDEMENKEESIGKDNKEYDADGAVQPEQDNNVDEIIDNDEVEAVQPEQDNNVDEIIDDDEVEAVQPEQNDNVDEIIDKDEVEAQEVGESEEMVVEEPVVEAERADELENPIHVPSIAKISTEAAEQLRLEVIKEEDFGLDEQQHQAILEGQHALEMESDDIEKRDPTGDRSSERQISSPRHSLDKQLTDGAASLEHQAKEGQSVNVQILGDTLRKQHTKEIIDGDESGHHLVRHSDNEDQLSPEFRHDGDKSSMANSDRSSPVDSSFVGGGDGTDDDDEEGDDGTNSKDTSGRASSAKKRNNEAASNQEKKERNKQQQQQQQQTGSKSRNKKNKRKGKK